MIKIKKLQNKLSSMEKNIEQLNEKEAYFTFQELQEAREEVIQKMLDQIKDEKLKETIRNKMK